MDLKKLAIVISILIILFIVGSALISIIPIVTVGAIASAGIAAKSIPARK